MGSGFILIKLDSFFFGSFIIVYISCVVHLVSLVIGFCLRLIDFRYCGVSSWRGVEVFLLVYRNLERIVGCYSCNAFFWIPIAI